MIKTILFDCDGPIIKHNKYFSQRLKEERGIVTDSKDELSFFNNEFLLCEAGKADLKVELQKRLSTWGWRGTVEELIDYWFSDEAEVDLEMKDYILKLRERSIKIFLSTNNEKYRLKYLWEVVGLNKFLDGTMASSELGYLKPQLEFWEQASKRISNIQKAEVLVIDDDETAIASAKVFGFNAELYTDLNSIKIKIDKYLNTV